MKEIFHISFEIFHLPLPAAVVLETAKIALPRPPLDRLEKWTCPPAGAQVASLNEALNLKRSVENPLETNGKETRQIMSNDIWKIFPSL